MSSPSPEKKSARAQGNDTLVSLSCAVCGQPMPAYPTKRVCSGRCRAALSRRRQRERLRDQLARVEAAQAELARVATALRAVLAAS